MNKSLALVKSAVVPECPFPLDAAIKSWNSRVANAVLSTVRSALSARRSNRSYSNLTPLVKYALRLLSNVGVGVIPNGKEGGYTIQTQSDHSTVVDEVLMQPEHIPLDLSFGLTPDHYV